MKKSRNTYTKLFDILDKKRITRAEKTRTLNQLSRMSIKLYYKRKFLDLTYDDDNYYGLKDIEYTFGVLDDCYKPILVKESFDGNYQLYT